MGSVERVDRNNSIYLEPLDAKIVNIDEWGLMKIKFSDKFVPINISLVNETVLNITIIPNLESSYVDKLQFNWWCTFFEEMEM